MPNAMLVVGISALDGFTQHRNELDVRNQSANPIGSLLVKKIKRRGLTALVGASVVDGLGFWKACPVAAHSPMISSGEKLYLLDETSKDRWMLG